MLTYADVQTIYRTERNSTSLQKIPDNFYSELKVLLSQIGDEHHSYIKKLISEIQEKRKNKILIQVMRGAEPPANVIPAEKELYNQITTLLQDYQSKLSFLDEETPEFPEKEPLEDKIVEESTPPTTEPKKTGEPHDKIKIKILKPLPEIIGPDAESYGPFSENSEVELPPEIAKILIEKGAAEKV